MLQTKANKDLEQSTKDVTAKLLSMLEIGARDRQITAWRVQPNAAQLRGEMYDLLKAHFVKLDVSVPSSCKQLALGQMAEGSCSRQSSQTLFLTFVLLLLAVLTHFLASAEAQKMLSGRHSRHLSEVRRCEDHAHVRLVRDQRRGHSRPHRSRRRRSAAGSARLPRAHRLVPGSDDKGRAAD